MVRDALKPHASVSKQRKIEAGFVLIRTSIDLQDLHGDKFC